MHPQGDEPRFCADSERWSARQWCMESAGQSIPPRRQVCPSVGEQTWKRRQPQGHGQGQPGGRTEQEWGDGEVAGRGEPPQPAAASAASVWSVCLGLEGEHFIPF